MFLCSGSFPPSFEVCFNTRGTKIQVLLIEALSFYDLRNLTSRNEMLCLCSLDGKNCKIH